MSEQQRNYDQQQFTPEAKAEQAGNECKNMGKDACTKTNDRLPNSDMKTRQDLLKAGLSVDENGNTNIDGVNYNIKDLITRDALGQPDKMVIADKTGITLSIVDKSKLVSSPYYTSGNSQKLNNVSYSYGYRTNVSGQHAYDRQGNNIGSKNINHGENGNTIDISKASKYRQEGAWIKGPNGNLIGPVNITVGEGKKMNLMDLIKGNLRQEGAWIKDSRGNVLCATNDPKFVQYRNLYGKGKV